MAFAAKLALVAFNARDERLLPLAKIFQEIFFIPGSGRILEIL